MTRHVWHVPPACQGQMVEVAYCQVDDGGILLRRTTDADRTITYHEIRLDDDEQNLEPWNEEPVIPGASPVESATSGRMPGPVGSAPTGVRSARH